MIKIIAIALTLLAAVSATNPSIAELQQLFEAQANKTLIDDIASYNIETVTWEVFDEEKNSYLVDVRHDGRGEFKFSGPRGNGIEVVKTGETSYEVIYHQYYINKWDWISTEGDMHMAVSTMRIWQDFSLTFDLINGEVSNAKTDLVADADNFILGW